MKKLALKQKRKLSSKKSSITFDPYDWAVHACPVVGVDEVGRGCLAGPVVAAAVLVDVKTAVFDPRITDSKKLNAIIREELSSSIRVQFRTAIGFATPEEIDELNILNASLLAMKRAVEGLGECSKFTLLVDGNFKIPDIKVKEQICLIKGDLRAKPVGAASIIAKVHRDLEMIQMAQEFPLYGFDVHKGYGTPFHREIIQKHGITRLHRRSFKGTSPGDYEGIEDHL